MVIPISSFNHPEIAGHMAAGDVIRINDGMVRFTVTDIDDRQVTFVPDLPGVLRRGKGFYMEKTGYRPQPSCLTDLDEAAHRRGPANRHRLCRHFIRPQHGRREPRSAVAGNGSTGFIPKIESRASLEHDNLLSLLSCCDRVIVDRGDMSGEMGLDAVWRQQRRIVDMAKILGCRVIMATQFLTSMMQRPLPTIAEVDLPYRPAPFWD